MTMHKQAVTQAVDGCFIFFGDVRFDSRLQNVLRSLSKQYSQLCYYYKLPSKMNTFTFERCQVLSFAVSAKLRGVAKFMSFYRKLAPKAFGVRATFFLCRRYFFIADSVLDGAPQKSPTLLRLA
jgi:hypothetical protein